MDVKQIQREIAKLGYAVGAPDGIAGRQTLGAVDTMLMSSNIPDWVLWTDSRRLVAVEQLILRDVHGIETGAIDGLVGEQTRYARSVWEARQKGPGEAKKVETWRDREPSVIPKGEQTSMWPKQVDAEMFYGTPGTGFIQILLPFPFRLAWEPQKIVTKATVHSKCAAAFQNVWKRTLDSYGLDRIKVLRLDMFGGAANVRRMRGGTRWSMHAYGCAWDIDPDRNQLKWGRDKALLDGAEYKPFWDIVYNEGGLSLGIERNYDWMHWQFTRDFS